MNAFWILIFVFFLFYIAGAGPQAFVGTTLLLSPFAKELLGYDIPTPLFFLISGVVMGAINNNASSPLLKEIFEISTLFLAYAASYEFTNSLKKNPFSFIKKHVLIEFIIVPLPFALYFLLMKISPLKSFTLSLLFLSISPITSMILLYETKLDKKLRERIEGGIIVRDGVLILLFTLLSHFAFFESKDASLGIIYAILIAPFLGGFLVLGNKIGKKTTYLFLPLAIVISILLEMYFNVSSIFLVFLTGFWESMFMRKGGSSSAAIELGKMLYPFVYTYTGQLIFGFTLNVVIMGFILLLLKVGVEYLQSIFSGCKFKKIDVSVKVPMAGLSFNHLLLFKEGISAYLFSLLAFVLIASEFLAPLFMTTFRNIKKKI